MELLKVKLIPRFKGYIFLFVKKCSKVLVCKMFPSAWNTSFSNKLFFIDNKIVWQSHDGGFQWTPLTNQNIRYKLILVVIYSEYYVLPKFAITFQIYLFLFGFISHFYTLLQMPKLFNKSFSIYVCLFRSSFYFQLNQALL